VKPTDFHIALDLNDLEPSGIEIQVLASAQALGLPELGATSSPTNSCSNVNCCVTK
jgi:hypothetical protein